MLREVGAAVVQPIASTSQIKVVAPGIRKVIVDNQRCYGVGSDSEIKYGEATIQGHEPLGPNHLDESLRDGTIGQGPVRKGFLFLDPGLQKVKGQPKPRAKEPGHPSRHKPRREGEFIETRAERVHGSVVHG